MKLSFRKDPPTTGLAGVGHPHPSTQIKGDKLCVGIINAPYWATKDSKWGIQLAVKSDKPENCDWAWIFFKQRFDTEPEARQWLKDRWDSICKKYSIHQFEDD